VGEKTGALTKKSLAEIALHSAKANPTPETIKKKPSTCGGGSGELDATPSIPIEPKETAEPRERIQETSSSKNPDQNHAEIRGLGRAISRSISHQPGHQ
jgi:hypothetical protein